MEGVQKTVLKSDLDSSFLSARVLCLHSIAVFWVSFYHLTTSCKLFFPAHTENSPSLKFADSLCLLPAALQSRGSHLHTTLLLQRTEETSGKVLHKTRSEVGFSSWQNQKSTRGITIKEYSFGGKKWGSKWSIFIGKKTQIYLLLQPIRPMLPYSG